MFVYKYELFLSKCNLHQHFWFEGIVGIYKQTFEVSLPFEKGTLINIYDLKEEFITLTLK